MPAWLAQWSTFVIALVLSIVFGGIVLGIFVPKIKNALFYRAVGSLVEAATRKAHERDEKDRGGDQQVTLRRERERRVAEAVDQLTEGLTNCLGILARGYTLEFRDAQPYITVIQRSMSELQREGPQEIQNQLGVISGQLAQIDQPFTRTWANSQVTAINAILRSHVQANNESG